MLTKFTVFQKSSEYQQNYAVDTPAWDSNISDTQKEGPIWWEMITLWFPLGNSPQSDLWFDQSSLWSLLRLLQNCRIREMGRSRIRMTVYSSQVPWTYITWCAIGLVINYINVASWTRGRWTQWNSSISRWNGSRSRVTGSCTGEVAPFNVLYQSPRSHSAGRWNNLQVGSELRLRKLARKSFGKLVRKWYVDLRTNVTHFETRISQSVTLSCFLISR